MVSEEYANSKERRFYYHRKGIHDLCRPQFCPYARDIQKAQEDDELRQRVDNVMEKVDIPPNVPPSRIEEWLKIKRRLITMIERSKLHQERQS